MSQLALQVEASLDELRRRRDEAELGDHDAAVGAKDEAVHARFSIDRLMTLVPPGQAQAITLVKIEGASIAEFERMTSGSAVSLLGFALLLAIFLVWIQRCHIHVT